MDSYSARLACIVSFLISRGSILTYVSYRSSATYEGPERPASAIRLLLLCRALVDKLSFGFAFPNKPRSTLQMYADADKTTGTLNDLHMKCAYMCIYICMYLSIGLYLSFFVFSLSLSICMYIHTPPGP